MSSRGERGILRVLDKIEASVNSGQYYEAHQMYRTLYFRYLSQRKYLDLLNLLYKGSTLFLQRDQQGSGADLAILFVDVLTKSVTKPTEEWLDKIAKLFELINSSIPEKETFLTNAVKWSMEDSKKGHPYLHMKIAEVYWKEKNYIAAHKHFLHSSDGKVYANMLIELHTTKALKSEIDLIITQAVLQLLCFKNLEMALDTFNTYIKKHPTIMKNKGPPYSYPLLNFLWFLLEIIQEKHVDRFKILRKTYAVTLKRDPNYSEYLDNIGKIWFGIKIIQKNLNQNSLFSGIFKSIIGDMDSSDEDGEIMHYDTPAPDLD